MARGCVVALCLSLATLRLVASIRDTVALDSGEEIQVGTNLTAPNAEMSGTHICCLDVGWDDWAIHVYHEKATDRINDCEVTLMSEIDCKGAEACALECKERLDRTPAFHEAISLIKEGRWTETVRGLQQEKDDRKASDAAAIEVLKEKKMAKLAPLKGTLVSAGQELADAKADLEEKEAALREATAAAEAARALVPELQAKADTAQSELTTTEEEEARALAEANDKMVKERNAFFAEKDEKIAEANSHHKQYEDYVATLQPQPLPADCEGSRDCCCITQKGVAMRVNMQFEDWNQCKKTGAYSKTSTWGFACHAFKECEKCRKLVCGDEMCI